MHQYKKKEVAWHPLDNAGSLFPLISNENFTNVFRVAVQLTAPIDPKLLQIALEKTLPWFSHFRFRIRRGFFWNYFESNTMPVVQVEEEEGRPCRFIDLNRNRNYLFKVLYYKNKISLEVFHALTDGTGAIGFLKALTTNYLYLSQGEAVQLDSRIVDVVSNPEDGYKKYYKKEPVTEQGVKSGMKLIGRKLPLYEMGIIHGHLDLSQVVEICRKKEVSMTVYLTSVYLWSLFRTQSKGRNRFKPIQVAVPVNLRRFFDSNSTMNFFSHITATLYDTDEGDDFESLLEKVKLQFSRQISKENFAAKIGKDVKLKKNFFIRITPLAIKNLFVRSIYLKSMRAYTSTLSNIGKVEFLDRHCDDIEHVEFLLNPTLTDPVKIGVVSYGNTLMITFTSQLITTDIQKEFFRKCASDGIQIQIETNGVYYETM